MPAEIIDGKLIASQIREDLKKDVEELKNKGITPGLGVILVGADPASKSYVTAKERACDDLGLYSENIKLPAETTEKDLLILIDEMNNNPKIDGILVQLPLPKHIDTDKIIMSILPSKDVDGFHPVSIGKMLMGKETFLPCTPNGIIKLLLHSKVQVEGANVVVVGRSNIVGKPVANLLLDKSEGGNATVTVCHSRTKNMAEITKKADILIAAIGKAEFITADMIKEGAVVIDVGVNRVDDSSKKRGYRLVGDVEYSTAIEKASKITPVPGGVGPMTITMLMYNTVESARNR
ncbi:MAG: bifunctional methylenetetrahydrofolate dehydrogenase/methenyltetrahydrofolate cyclohydrolase FolD [Spirochaetia bacterium]|jgi:methylenetetrahydrofolate dehydrogenase (NADP+)/methenyltetrahydrofolate cyclohydrolase|nr:bifunctional methylenetetrahydrofolate dehydrogenase/methenyltetrahydrofolate cyclohydrolase FolD [Spirochaetia bacterium]